MYCSKQKISYKDRFKKINIAPLEYRKEMTDSVLLNKSELGLTSVNYSDYFHHVSEIQAITK